MIKLFINTVLENIELAVLKDGKVLKLINYTKDRNESEKIIPLLDGMLEELDLQKSDIKSVFLVNGPGEFTSLRIGHIIAKAIAVNLKIDLFVCSTFEYVISRSKSKNYTQFLLNAGGDYVYKFGLNELEDQKNFEIVKLSDCNLKDTGVWFELSNKQLKNSMITENQNAFDSLNETWKDVETVMKKVDKIEELEPNYIKEPNIT